MFSDLLWRRDDEWPRFAFPGILWIVRHGSLVNQPVEVGFGNVRPLFALAYVYSTKYNEKRRMEPMALGT